VAGARGGISRRRKLGPPSAAKRVLCARRACARACAGGGRGHPRAGLQPPIPRTLTSRRRTRAARRRTAHGRDPARRSERHSRGATRREGSARRMPLARAGRSAIRTRARRELRRGVAAPRSDARGGFHVPARRVRRKGGDWDRVVALADELADRSTLGQARATCSRKRAHSLEGAARSDQGAPLVRAARARRRGASRAARVRSADRRVAARRAEAEPARAVKKSKRPKATRPSRPVAAPEPVLEARRTRRLPSSPTAPPPVGRAEPEPEPEPAPPRAALPAAPARNETSGVVGASREARQQALPSATTST
jgi:hypothetical protein